MMVRQSAATAAWLLPSQADGMRVSCVAMLKTSCHAKLLAFNCVDMIDDMRLPGMLYTHDMRNHKQGFGADMLCVRAYLIERLHSSDLSCVYQELCVDMRVGSARAQKHTTGLYAHKSPSTGRV